LTLQTTCSILPNNHPLFHQLAEAQHHYEKAVTLLSKPSKVEHKQSDKVPTELPFIQWKNHIVTRRERVFSSPQSCLRKFENVLKAHLLDIETNWKRLVSYIL
jgi:hypothetical protein